MNPKLKSFVDNAFDRNKTPDWARQKLTEAGWSRAEIEEALEDLRGQIRRAQESLSGVSIHTGSGILSKARETVEHTLRLYRKKVSEPVVIIGESGKSRMGYDIVEQEAYAEKERTRKIHAYQGESVPPPPPRREEPGLEMKSMRVRYLLMAVLTGLVMAKGIQLSFF